MLGVDTEKFLEKKESLEETIEIDPNLEDSPVDEKGIILSEKSV